MRLLIKGGTESLKIGKRIYESTCSLKCAVCNYSMGLSRTCHCGNVKFVRCGAPSVCGCITEECISIHQYNDWAEARLIKIPIRDKPLFEKLKDLVFSDYIEEAYIETMSISIPNPIKGLFNWINDLIHGTSPPTSIL